MLGRALLASVLVYELVLSPGIVGMRKFKCWIFISLVVKVWNKWKLLVLFIVTDYWYCSY